MSDSVPKNGGNAKPMGATDTTSPTANGKDWMLNPGCIGDGGFYTKTRDTIRFARLASNMAKTARSSRREFPKTRPMSRLAHQSKIQTSLHRKRDHSLLISTFYIF